MEVFQLEEFSDILIEQLSAFENIVDIEGHLSREVLTTIASMISEDGAPLSAVRVLDQIPQLVRGQSIEVGIETLFEAKFQQAVILTGAGLLEESLQVHTEAIALRNALRAIR